jgi:hypothetical protein
MDQLSANLRGVDPRVLLEFSQLIEKRANARCKDLPAGSIKFRGSVDDEGRFALDPIAPSPDAMVCLLKAIDDSLDLMPYGVKEFYAAVMSALASYAERSDS